MLPLLQQALLALGRFAFWFDHRFGWFFTNGMKERRWPDGPSLKA